MAKSTFHDFVNKGKIIPMKGIRGFYLLNASLSRLGLREVPHLPERAAIRSTEDIVQLAFYHDRSGDFSGAFLDANGGGAGFDRSRSRETHRRPASRPGQRAEAGTGQTDFLVIASPFDLRIVPPWQTPIHGVHRAAGELIACPARIILAGGRRWRCWSRSSCTWSCSSRSIR